MRILKLLKRLISRKAPAPAPRPLDEGVRELQKKLLDAARENGRPRIGG